MAKYLLLKLKFPLQLVLVHHSVESTQHQHTNIVWCKFVDAPNCIVVAWVRFYACLARNATIISLANMRQKSTPRCLSFSSRNTDKVVSASTWK